MIELEFWKYSSGFDKARMLLESLLSPQEQHELERMTIPQRRDEWLASRWLAKQLIRQTVKIPDEEIGIIEIKKDFSGKPWVMVSGEPFGSISLSHSGGAVLAGFSQNEADIFGCDLEKITSHSEAFLEDYFTTGEQSWLADSEDLPRDSSLLWSIKEAAMKALGRGLSMDTRIVECRSWLHQITTPSGWQQFEISVAGLPYQPRAAWRQVDEYVLTICQLAGPAEVELKLTIKDPGV